MMRQVPHCSQGKPNHLFNVIKGFEVIIALEDGFDSHLSRRNVAIEFGNLWSTYATLFTLLSACESHGSGISKRSKVIPVSLRNISDA